MMLQSKLRIQPNGEIPENLNALTKWVLAKQDPYSALALYPFVSNRFKKKLEYILFASRRLQYVFAAAHYTPDSVLDLLASEENGQLHSRILKHPNTAAGTIEKLYKRGCSDQLLVLIASHPNTPEDILAEINWQGLEKIRMALCGNHNTPLSLINELLIDSSLKEKKVIVRHPLLNEEILETLWDEGDKYLKAEIVARHFCPARLIAKAIKNNQVIIRQKLAANPAIGDVIQHQLLMDDDARVRAAIVKNQEVSEHDLEQLCDDPSYQVRRNEARRSGLSASVIVQLADDKDHWVRRWTARNPATPETILRQLAIDEDENVRRSVARNQACCNSLLNKLIKDSSAWVRAGVAMRTDISKESLLKLVDDEDIDVQSAIGKNPNTPVKALKSIAKSNNHDVRRSVILNKKITAKVLQLFIEDPYPLNRIILASRPQCGLQTIWKLANDPDDEVRFSVIRSFVIKMVKDKTEECEK